MNKADGQDRRGRLSAIVANSLDTQAKTQDLARQAYQSRTQFHRLFRTVVEETPAAMRRRLLLERAAYQLAHGGMSVTDIALDANYGSLEAFTRAFRKAFRISPSLYRRMRDPHFHLPTSNKIHFLPRVPRQKEEETWICSIVLQAMTHGTRGGCWNTRVL
jgi:AraC family transcriptional regulator